MLLALFLVFVVLFVILPLVGVALWWVLTTALTGLVVGALGRLVVPGRQPIGVLATIVAGFAGALIGGALGHLADAGRVATTLLDIAVAALLVAGYTAARRKSLVGGRPPLPRPK